MMMMMHDDGDLDISRTQVIWTLVERSLNALKRQLHVLEHVLLSYLPSLKSHNSDIFWPILDKNVISVEKHI